MTYFSLNQKAPEVSFEEAVIRGLAPDGGLYFPKNIKPLEADFFKNIHLLDDSEIALRAIEPFIGEDIPKSDLIDIVQETLCFDFPCKKIEENLFSLELFHGPTMAFKDIGARFMARCLRYFNRQKKSQKVTVLVATSGDTGGAVANGFFGVDGVQVVILYPSGKVSDIQEKQLTTLGKNITALEVDGSFDDCQKMVKRAFVDADLKGLNLTSANSINIARWLPQMFYFLITYKVFNKHNPPTFVVPSGNFGNICAGMMANKIGMPVEKFIAATNINDTVPRYLQSGNYLPKDSMPTISNAMDVGNPSNFIRIQELFNNDFKTLKASLISESYTDSQTKDALKTLYNNYHYLADPHGAVAYLAAKNFISKYPEKPTIFLETAHPAKFLDVVEETINMKIKVPPTLEFLLDKKKQSLKTSSYLDLKEFLLS